MTGPGQPAAAPRILALWSAPRSRSSAFLKMMAERGDYLVVHEPFSHVADFGTARVGDITVRSEAGIIAALHALARRTPVFFKDTTDFAYPGLLADPAFLRWATHTFLIRDPAEVIASHYALNPALQRDEIGIARLAGIYDAVRCQGTLPVVIDSGDLVARPAATVAAYCAAVGIPFLPDALSWQPGFRAEWERARRWHETAGRTGGFVPVARSYAATIENEPRLAEYFAFHLPFYERMRASRLVVPA